MPDTSLKAVRMLQNMEHAGIELYFSEKPERALLNMLKEHGFRWHNKERFWFAKSTPERVAFAQKLTEFDASELKSQQALHSLSEELSSTFILKDTAAHKPSAASSAEIAKKSNTFAASYDSIGDAKILPAVEGDLFTHMEAYFEAENLYFRRTFGGDGMIKLIDLHNAQKTGETCEEWRISPAYGERQSLLTLLNREGIDSIPQLLELCRSGKVPENLSICTQTYKGVDMFSPFVEVKPLKALPEKWTKRNFAQALMSGQLYRGEVDYRYTDDYAYDAAVGFRSGVSIQMPVFVKNEVGDWGVCTTCRNGQDTKDEYDGSPVHYSEHQNSSKTLWFDVNCDIAEGKRRTEARQQSILEYNGALEASCIRLTPEQIEPNKCYTLKTLDTNTNNGIHATKEEILQGYVLQDRLGPDGYCPHIVSAEALEIEPTKFYVIADFFHRREYAEDDPRIIACGNWKQIVTGKALLELTAEGTYVPVIEDKDPEYDTYASASAHLLDQAIGRSMFLFSKKEDFAVSLYRLEHEYKRAGQRDLQSIIREASARQMQPVPDDSAPEHER